MARQASGEIRWRDGLAIARVTLQGKERASFELPTCKTDAEARERAKLLAMLVRRLRAAQIDPKRAQVALRFVATSDASGLPSALRAIEALIGGTLMPKPESGVPTVRKLAADWFSGALHARHPDQIKLKSSARADRLRFEKHVRDVMGDLPIDRVTLDHAEEVMRRLPAKLAVGTRRQVGALITRILSMAVYPLRYIEHSPIPKGFMPKAGKGKAKAYVYPSEDRRLLACTAVPLEYRLLWGFLTREGTREGEALALTWSALDLERGGIALDENKTDDARPWALDPGVAEALRRFKKRYRPDAKPTDQVMLAPGGKPISPWGLADTLRDHLIAIGLKSERPELFVEVDNASRRRIVVHDLRGTFVTLALANGRSESWISDRTGHQSSQMINRYKRNARTFAELDLGQLTPMHEAIPELAGAIDYPGSPTSGGNPRETGSNPNLCQSQASELQSRETANSESGSERSSAIVGAQGQAVGNESAPIDPIDVALLERIRKLDDETAALRRDLEARQHARAGVVDLAAERKRRER